MFLFAFLYFRPFWNRKLKSMTLSIYNFYISQTSTSNTSTSYSIGIQSITQPLLIYIYIYIYIYILCTYVYILPDQGLIVAPLHFEAPGVAAKNLSLKCIPQLRGTGKQTKLVIQMPMQGSPNTSANPSV
jgi:hypothetical protein